MYLVKWEGFSDADNTWVPLEFLATFVLLCFISYYGHFVPFRIVTRLDTVFGIWHLASGIWHLAFGIWHLAFGVWRLAFGIWRLAFGHLAFGIWASGHLGFWAFGIWHLASGIWHLASGRCFFPCTEFLDFGFCWDLDCTEFSEQLSPKNVIVDY